VCSPASRAFPSFFVRKEETGREREREREGEGDRRQDNKREKRTGESGNEHCGAVMQLQLRPSYSRRSRTMKGSKENREEERRKRLRAMAGLIHEERTDKSTRSLLPIHYFAKRRSPRRQGQPPWLSVLGNYSEISRLMKMRRWHGRVQTSRVFLRRYMEPENYIFFV